MIHALVPHAFLTAVAHAFRRTALPLAAYYAITLGVPLANGAARAGAPFVEHALIVLAIPPALIVIACALSVTTWRRHHSDASSPTTCGRP